MSEHALVTLLVGLLGFAGVCVTAYATIRSATKKSHAELSARLDDLQPKVNALVEHDHEQYLSLLRLTVMSPDMPLSERLIAGKKYAEAGGNGDVKKYYQELIKEHII